MFTQKKTTKQKFSRRIAGLILALVTLLSSSLVYVMTAHAFTYEGDDKAIIEMRSRMIREAELRRSENKNALANESERVTQPERPDFETRLREAESRRTDAEFRQPEQNRNTSSSAVPPEYTTPSERQTGQQLGLQTERNVNSTQNVSADWMLALVNAGNPLPDDFSPKLKSLTNGLQFDERAIDQLNTMLTAMRAQGLSPVVCSAYRTFERQRTLFDNKVSVLIASGLTQTQAEAEARKSIAYPGTSEHNLGLAADIVAMSYQLLDEKQATTPEIKWLLEHCAEYGFILRYPKGKETVTEVKYEPWHFRFVGVTAAREIMASGICLEEY